MNGQSFTCPRILHSAPQLTRRQGNCPCAEEQQHVCPCCQRTRHSSAPGSSHPHASQWTINRRISGSGERALRGPGLTPAASAARDTAGAEDQRGPCLARVWSLLGSLHPTRPVQAQPHGRVIPPQRGSHHQETSGVSKRERVLEASSPRTHVPTGSNRLSCHAESSQEGPLEPLAEPRGPEVTMAGITVSVDLC